MAGESNWVVHVRGAAGSSWVQLRAPYPDQRCAFAAKMPLRRDADSRMARRPGNAGVAPAPPRAAGREGVTPTAQERGDGLERRPPVGTARRRRAESRIAKDRDGPRLGPVPIPGRSAFPYPAALLFTPAGLRCAEVRCERVGGAVDVCRGRPAEMTEAQNLARKPSESSRQNDSVTLLKGA